MAEPETSPCPREDCENAVRPGDIVCGRDFTLLASACRGKKRLGQPEADMIEGRGRGNAYPCPLCRQWHNGGRPQRAAQMRTVQRATVRSLHEDQRCGPEGLLNLIDTWHPERVNRDSWALGLDQREAYALPFV